MLNDLAELIAINSVQSEPKENKPFGEGVSKALDWVVEKAKSFGLCAENINGYAATAEYGEGEKCIGILCHTDVVPCGDGWSYPPFALTEDNGNLYGRGVVDDKGSVVIALHVLKALKDNNVKTKNRIRLIVGGGEENGSACMKYYVAHCEIPKFSVVPDSDFPIITSEKGILHLGLSSPVCDDFSSSVISFDSGSRPNVVPAFAKMVIKRLSPLGKRLDEIAGANKSSSIIFAPQIATSLRLDGVCLDDFSVNFFSDTIEVTAVGKAGHAMKPEDGDNAIWKCFAFLKAFPLFKNSVIPSIYSLFCSPASQERLHIDCQDDKSGELTMNLGMINFKNNQLNLTLDLRLPITAVKEDVISNIKNASPLFTLTEEYFAPNLFIKEDSPLVKTLLSAYEAVTKEKGYCVKSGGGTYARELPNAVAFGPTFPNMITNIHNADECIPKVDFERLFDIYYQAIIDLDNL